MSDQAIDALVAAIIVALVIWVIVGIAKAVFGSSEININPIPLGTEWHYVYLMDEIRAHGGAIDEEDGSVSWGNQKSELESE